VDARLSPSRRIRVLTLVDYLSLAGGAERLALELAVRLDRERFESILCVSRFFARGDARLRDSDLRALDRVEQTHLRLLPLKRERTLNVGAWVRLARFLRRERVDVLHAHKFGSNVWGTLVGRTARVPVVLAHEHTWSYQGQPLRRFLDRELIARGADRLIAVSREDRRRMIEVEGIDERRTVFIPNGIVGLPPPSGRDVRTQLGIEPASPLLGVVGTLRPQKAHGTLLRGLTPLRAEWPGVRLLIIGSGPERSALEQLAQELGVDASVRFLGDRADIPDLLAALDVAVCCSDFEGSPLSVMEYMDAGLPIVATTVGGVPDLIDNEVHGLLVPPGDPDALAAAIAAQLRDRERARAMGTRARERRRTEFDIEVQVRRIEALYTELLEQRGGSHQRGA
jgi:glycosyltransferase involved in cell wall biosynthesis